MQYQSQYNQQQQVGYQQQNSQYTYPQQSQPTQQITESFQNGFISNTYNTPQQPQYQSQYNQQQQVGYQQQNSQYTYPQQSQSQQLTSEDLLLKISNNIKQQIAQPVVDDNVINNLLDMFVNSSTEQENKIEQYFYKELYGQKIIKDEFKRIENKIIYANNLVKQKFLQKQSGFTYQMW